MDKELREKLKDIELSEYVSHGDETYRCIYKKTVGYYDDKKEITFIESYNRNNVKNRKITVMHKDIPIIKIDVKYNDNFEKLLDLKFYYYRENKYGNNRKYYTPVLAYEFKKSIGNFRFWTQCNRYELGLEFYDHLTNREQYIILLYDALKMMAGCMRDDPDNTVYKHVGTYGRIYDITDSFKDLHTKMVNYFEEIPNRVTIDYNEFMDQINKKREDLKDGSF